MDPDPRISASDPHPQPLASVSNPQSAKSYSFLSESGSLLRISTHRQDSTQNGVTGAEAGRNHVIDDLADDVTKGGKGGGVSYRQLLQ